MSVSTTDEAHKPRTLYDKLWDSHLVGLRQDGNALIYIDRQLLHEVTSPQAFEGLRLAERKPWRISANIATPDHNVPTVNQKAGVAGITDPVSRIQVETLDSNCDDFGILEFRMNDARQGIVHVIGPEQGATLPGMTVVCGDSHTSTHGAFGALAHGIGTSEVEHVMATQCLATTKMKNMLIRVSGRAPKGIFAKDIVLAIIGRIGTAGGNGHAIEFAGEAIEALSLEGRMTVCNMAIEAGARAGMIAVDETTIEYFKGRPFSPGSGAASQEEGEAQWQQAANYWRTLHSDSGAHFDKTVDIDISSLAPQITWGTSPEMVLAIGDRVPDGVSQTPGRVSQSAEARQRALRYMGLEAGQAIEDVQLDRVFIGSCTNSRIEDLRVAAAVVKGRKVATTLKQALVVPGSGLVKLQAEKEGLDKIFIDAGLEWREPGCSMCLAMNADRLGQAEHCASTSNRNFESRQGLGGRTHLVSPAMAAAAAIFGHFVDIRTLEPINSDDPDDPAVGSKADGVAA